MRRSHLRSLVGALAVCCASLAAPVAALDIAALRGYLREVPAGNGGEVAAPQLGQPVALSLDVRVSDADQPLATEVRALLDGVEYCAGSLALLPGDGLVFCPAAWPATAGAHVLRWEIDPAGAIAESDETNNALELRFATAASQPIDLRAGRAFLRRGAGEGDEVRTPNVGEAVFPHVTYEVVGASAAVSAQITATLDGAFLCGGVIGFAPEGATVWCNDAWIATPGTHLLRWQLDDGDAVVETDEDNNASQVSIGVGAACAGDCDRQGSVGIAELIQGVGIALGSQPLGGCTSLDADADGRVEIGELIAAVGRALDGCG